MPGLKERARVIENIRYEIIGLEERFKRSRENALKITPAYKVINVQESNSGGSKIESHVVKESEILEEIKAKTIQIEQLRNELERDIDRMEDKRMGLLLKLKYMYGYEWEYIARQVNYSEAHTKNVYHEKCIEVFEKLMLNDVR